MTSSQFSMLSGVFIKFFKILDIRRFRSLQIISVVVGFILSTYNYSFAASIDKGFQALAAFNYFEAKLQFEKSLTKEPSAANYGLAVIYLRTDNPFHNLDSALIKINRSEATYSQTNEKTKAKLKVYQFDYLAIVDIRNEISRRFFDLALKTPTEEGFNAFQQVHTWSQNRFLAIHLRDSIALQKAASTEKSIAYNQFLKTYPESEFVQQVKLDFNRLQYLEQTATGTLVAYIGFITDFPTSPYCGDAQDQIYRIVTASNSVEAHATFIKMYPNNRNIDQSWRKLYQLFMYDYSEARLDEFQTTYPDYPFKSELLKDKELASEVLLPYKKESVFGWMNTAGKSIITAQYESVGFFKEGLAWVEKNGKYGFVNKLNEVLIDLKYDGATDFEKGRAIVELDRKFGIIDRSGTLIFPTIYADLGQFSENLIYAQKDSLYGYLDGFGMQRIEPKFLEAFSFSEGKAKVNVDGLEAFIDPYGSYLVPPVYEKIDFFSDTLLRFTEGDFVGIMNRRGQVIVPATYDFIGELNNDRALCIKNEKVGFLTAIGNEILVPQFELYINAEQQSNFAGNFSKVQKAGKFGIIDRDGKPVIPFQYTKLGAVSTLMAFEKKGLWGFIDRTNKLILQPIYEYAESFQDEVAIVQQVALQGTINSKGIPLIPCLYTTVKRIDKTHYLATLGAKNGIYSHEGQLLVPVEYNQIRKMQDDLYLLLKGNDVHYFSFKDNQLIVPVE